MKLELGCGMKPTPGYLHHDRIAHSPHVDIAVDLEQVPWPWPSGSCEEVLAIDVLEHLHHDIPVWLNECHRILAPGGLLDMRLPAWDNPLSYRDPTHHRFFHEETFYYWDPSHHLFDGFGRYYFAEADRWWEVEAVTREFNDLRYRMRRLESLTAESG